MYCHRCQKHNLISILDDCLSKNICAYFKNRYSLEEHSVVKSGVIDLNANYQLFIRRLFPRAKIIIDRFHIVQLVNQVFDQLRGYNFKATKR
ncbi:transposase [Lactiplantibacillus plantarum]|uniref:transposase n=1 Tax=Lactiplantibacillus plantarum TaxID=1590 RepID=UPI00374EFFA1